ncbi:ATPase [Saccharothrix sp. CB00851]|nr:ATPase [Saccharothrix sp. CB00851]
MRAEVERAVGSHGGLVLVAGEAGIGKTTLVTGAAGQARRSGALVLGGSCWDSDSAPGYWPWVQVIRGLRRAVTAREWESVDPGPLAVLLGEAPSEHTPESFPLFDAVTSALVAVSHQRPVVVVLEDLHWADPASLKLLEFAAQHTWFERVLVIGTYRDTEVDAEDHPLRPLMTPLLGRAATVALTGLSPGEVGELMTRTAGREPDADLVAEVHSRTGGNPFFVEQTARLWHGGGPVTAIAPGVRDALRRRLSLLPAQVGELLTTAAVVGREFHRRVLAAVASLPVPAVDRLLDQAVQARLVVGSGGGRFSFAHDLVRETLYGALSDVDAAHAAVVRALDGEPAEEVLPADLARHAHLAGERLDPDRAVDLIVAAARDASRRMAVEEAAGHYRRALERAAGARRRIAVALELGNELYHCAEPVEAQRVFDEAAALARELDDPEPFARVALAVYRFAEDEDRAGVVVREAYDRLIGPPPDVPTEVLAREISLHAIEAARGGGDDDALASGLWAVHDTTWGIGNAEQRLALTDELITVSRRSGAQTGEYFATSFRWVALVELGDPRYLDQVHSFVALSERLGMTRFAFSAAIDQSIIAVLQGRYAEAEALLVKATELGASSHTGFRLMYLHLWWALRLSQGEFAALDELMPELLASNHPFPGLLTGIAAVERGDVAGTPVQLGQAAQDDRNQLSFEGLWLRFQAQFAHAAGDRELAARVRERLAPHRGKWLVSLYGCDISGPVDLWLGLVDLVLGRCDEAVEELTAAQRSAERMRAVPWAERARRHLAEVPASEVVRGVEFRRDGDVWALSYDGVTVRMPDSKGLRDLHVLVSSPGEPVAAVALLAPEAVASARLGGDPVLDDEAKARYRRRLARLDEEIDHAVDDERAAVLDRERAALLDELRAAAGLAGRTRRLGDEAERARKAVTARIRDALRKLDGRHPGLAAHLRETVSTGATCVYSGHLRL